MEIRKEYLTRRQAAEYCIKQGLPVSPKTLAKYACVGGGPKFRKFGKMRVVYKIADWTNGLSNACPTLLRRQAFECKNKVFHFYI